MLTELLKNIPLNTDVYKTSHYLQYPPHTQFISSYIESRGGKYDRVMSFGLQGFIKEYLMTPITKEDIDFAESIIVDELNAPFNRAGWEYIVDVHGGYLPVEIESVPEGTIVPNKNVTTQIVNTDPNCAWLTGYLETALLRATWYQNTVATKSWHAKQIIQSHMEKTCDDLGKLPYMLNDFGARAATSTESAALGGMAHLVNFTGSDTLSGILAAKVFYGYKGEKQGIPAAEHSTITSWGKDRETNAYRNMIKQFAGPGKIVAVVSDSYDLWDALENKWGGELKDEVVTNGGTIVVRPDSGDPVEVVCKTLEILEKKFGTTLNTKKYKILPPYIRMIQGDGVCPESIDAILTAMEKKGFSADNICFGMGGELLQKLDRDTQKYAMKAAAIRISEEEPVMIGSTFDIEGDWHDIYKDPVTDPGKRSKSGLLALTFDENGNHITVRRDQLNGRKNLMQPVFRNGKLLNDVDFNQVRETAAISGRFCTVDRLCLAA